MTTPTVDLTRVSILAEIVLRAGDAKHADAVQRLQSAYNAPTPGYPDTVGLSTLFHVGSSLDDLARAGHFPHSKISFSVVGKIVRELGLTGYQLVLFVTPLPILPDHHSLAVSRAGSVRPMLPADAAEALIRALDVIDNPYRKL